MRVHAPRRLGCAELGHGQVGVQADRIDLAPRLETRRQLVPRGAGTPFPELDRGIQDVGLSDTSAAGRGVRFAATRGQGDARQDGEWCGVVSHGFPLSGSGGRLSCPS